MTRLRQTPAQMAKAIERFNADNPVGTRVRCWTGLREGEGTIGVVREPATVLGGHTAVTWISGVRGCVALSHVERAP